MRYQRDVDRTLERKMRHQPTDAEKELWRGLRHSTFKFRRQHRIQNYIADFFCPEVQLIVEVDGSAHENEYAQERDHERDLKLRKLGFNIFRIFEDGAAPHPWPLFPLTRGEGNEALGLRNVG